MRLCLDSSRLYASLTTVSEQACNLMLCVIGRCVLSLCCAASLPAVPLIGQSNLQSAAPGTEGRPNIVMIFTDDQGWNDVGCYGSEIPTPNMDAIAAAGARLTQFYAASSICTPSRYGLLTGKYPTRSQDQLLGALMFLAPEDGKRGIHKGEVTYPSLLEEAGYRTALIGKWHLGHGEQKFWPTQHGFQTFFGHTGGCVDFFSLHYGTKPDWYRGSQLVETQGYATDVIADEAIRFIKSQDSARPFYLHLSFNAPHFGKSGNFATGEIKNKMQPKAADLLQVPEAITEPLRRAFAAKVIGLDASIGAILAELEARGLASNTIVIFMTDHGGAPDYGGSNLPLRGGKATLFEGGLRVPCMIRWPGVIPAGSQSDAMTCAIDVFPTLCSIAGIAPELSAGCDGQDIMHLLTESDSQAVAAGKKSRSEGLSSQTRAWNESRSLIWQTGSHKELGRKNWLAYRKGDYKLVDAPTADPMLFNVRNDPNEQMDLATNEPEQLAALRAESKRILTEHRPTAAAPLVN